MDFLAQLPRQQLILYYIPVVGIFTAVFTTVFLVANYRFCMARYLLVDETKIGAFAALHLSGKMTKGNRWNLFKLDLSFWWYSLVLAMITTIAFVPEVLRLLQVQLPVSDTVASLLAGVVSLALELVWMVYVGPYNMLAWGCAYDTLLTPAQQPEAREETV